MKTATHKLLYMISFVGLAFVAAIGLSRISEPAMAAPLLWAVLAACLAGAPGLARARAWPAALVLLPVGAYLLLRLLMPLPPGLDGAIGQAHFYYHQLQSGAHAYIAQRFPLDAAGTADLELFLTLVAYAAAGLAAFVALSLRRPLPGIAVCLAMLGFGLTVDSTGRIVSLPLAFVVLTCCVLALSRSLSRRHWRVRDAVAGTATALTGVLLALILLGATPVSAAKPWADWRSWSPSRDAIARISFDWMANYPSLLDRRSDVPVMQVTSPVAGYWRANALDLFDGRAWISNQDSGPLPPSDVTGDTYTYTVPGREPASRGRSVAQTFDIRALDTGFLFAGGSPTRLVLDVRTPVYLNGVCALRLVGAAERSLRYTVTAVVSQPRPRDLVGLGRTYSMDMTRFLSLPFPRTDELAGSDRETSWRTAVGGTADGREWLGLARLNRRVVGDATDPYEITLRIEEYLRSGSRFSYSLAPPETGHRSPYAAFLFHTRTGYCQHFAGAMAVLLRFNGIPARVAVGFATGERLAPRTYMVSRTDAHAWVEAYFPGYGWIPFDPTPGNSLPGWGSSSSSVGFVDPFTGAAAQAKQGSEPSSTADRRTRAEAGPATGDGTRRSGGPGWLWWVLVPAAALLLWPCGRAILRDRGRRRGSLDARLRASVRLVYADLLDFGVRVPPSQTMQETARFLAGYLDLDASTIMQRVEAVLFGGRAATHQDLADLADLRRRVRRRLRTRAGWTRTLLAAYGRPLSAR